jgi:uncharacterized membrane protein YgaE (UPF0421/DUF939 family)
MNLRTHLASAQLALRAATAAGVSLAAAQLFQLQHPLYAMVASVIVTDLSPKQSRRLGLIRLAATFLGAISGALMALVLPAGPIAVAFAVAATMLICVLAWAGDGARVGGYIAAIVVFEHNGSPWEYASFRLIETVLGVVIAWLVSFVPKLIKIEDDEEEQAAKTK